MCDAMAIRRLEAICSQCSQYINLHREPGGIGESRGHSSQRSANSIMGGPAKSSSDPAGWTAAQTDSERADAVVQTAVHLPHRLLRLHQRPALGRKSITPNPSVSACAKSTGNAVTTRPALSNSRRADRQSAVAASRVSHLGSESAPPAPRLSAAGGSH